MQMMSAHLKFWFGLVCLLRTFATGYSSKITEEKANVVVNEVLKNLPNALCDMIVVSSSPFHGKTLVVKKEQNLSSFMIMNRGRVIWVVNGNLLPSWLCLAFGTKFDHKNHLEGHYY